MEKSKQRITKRNKIIEAYFVEKEIYYPSSPDRIITTWGVPEFVLEDGRIMSGEYSPDGVLFFREVKSKKQIH